MENENPLQAISPGSFAKFLKLNTETLRGYSIALEKAGYLFMKSDGGHRRYIQEDFAVFNIFVNRMEAGFSVDGAAKYAVEEMAKTKKSHSPGSTDLVLNSENAVMPPQMLQLLEQLEQRVNEAVTSAVKDALQEQAATFALEARQSKFDRLIERQIEKTLRQEAGEKWSENPVMTGRFFKREDESAKANFIQNYIDEHYEERYREKFGLDI